MFGWVGWIFVVIIALALEVLFWIGASIAFGNRKGNALKDQELEELWKSS